MRARSTRTGRFDGARHAVGSGLVGTGERLEARPEDLSEAILATVALHGDKSGRMLHRFAELPDGAFVWTRTAEDEYRLGKITGPWRYDESPGATETGIHQVRPAEWHPRIFDPIEIPQGVAATFARGGKNLQRIRDEEVEALTETAWDWET